MAQVDDELIRYILYLNIPMAVHGPTYDMLIGAIDPYVREATKRRICEALNIAKKINASFIVLHINYIEDFYKHRIDKWIENASNLLDSLTDEYSIDIHLENQAEKDPKIFSHLLKNLNNKRVGFCIDVGHILGYSNRPIEEWIDETAPWIREIHLHETIRKKDLHLPLGKGLINWNRIIELLEENGIKLRELTITLEPRSEADLIHNLKYLDDLLRGHS